MPPGNRLAPMSQNAFGAPPTLAEIQLAARTAQRPAPLTLGERAQEINYGLGRGFTNVLQGNLGLAQALYQDPRAVGSAFVDAARGLAADPVGVVGNSLRGMWNRAKSGPAGLGEVVGENIDPRNLLKPKKAVTSAIDRKFPTIPPERAQAMREDLMGKAVKGEITWDEYYARSKPLLDVELKADALKRQRENQGKPPGPVFDGIDAKDVPRGTRVLYAKYPGDTPQPVTVHSTYLMNTKQGGYRGLVLEFEDGKTVRALNSQIKEIFMPRAAKPSAAD